MTAIPRITELKVGEELPVREYQPDTIQLFLYNAVLWNAHKIHFDYPYATEVEGYPALVLAGPLFGDWLHQCVVDWIGEAGRLKSIEYSNRRAGYIGDTLRSAGKVTAVDIEQKQATIELAILNQKDEVLAPGKAVVEFY